MATNESSPLYRLMAWLSPAFPVGAFSYSHGIEWLVETGEICDVETLKNWLGDILRLGSGRNDAIFFAEAYRAAKSGDFDALRDIAELASAFAASAERKLETMAQGRAFSDTARNTWKSPTLDRLALSKMQAAYPVAVAIAAADHGIDLAPSLEAYVHAFTANLISAAVRLIPLGQTDGQRALIAMEEAVSETVATAMTSDLSKLGGSALMADMASMKHETQYTRLFRS